MGLFDWSSEVLHLQTTPTNAGQKVLHSTRGKATVHYYQFHSPRHCCLLTFPLIKRQQTFYKGVARHFIAMAANSGQLQL